LIHAPARALTGLHKLRAQSAITGLLLLAACGGETTAALPPPAPLPAGAPSGIEDCDSFVKAACECASSVEAAKDACAIAQKSASGWHAVAEVPDQRDAAAEACRKARAALQDYGCAQK
jgi:hypothetical protein